MKKIMKLVPAFIMLLVSAILLSTATFAWFSMNTQVMATGMKVEAKAEEGIVIANSGKVNWTSLENASYSNVAQLYPTSTSDTLTWYHSSSQEADDANSGHAATELINLVFSDTTNNEGVGYVESGDTNGFQNNEDGAYYLMNKFFVRSSGNALTNTTLYINTVTVESTQNSTAHALENLDASLRVAIVIDSVAYIYAPNVTKNPTFSYTVNGATAVTALNPVQATAGGTGIGAYGAGKNVATTITTISNLPASAVEVDIYVYFEGEDENCKSTNISGITMNTLNVSVQLGITTIS